MNRGLGVWGHCSLPTMYVLYSGNGFLVNNVVSCSCGLVGECWGLYVPYYSLLYLYYYVVMFGVRCMCLIKINSVSVFCYVLCSSASAFRSNMYAFSVDLLYKVHSCVGDVRCSCTLFLCKM